MPSLRFNGVECDLGLEGDQDAGDMLGRLNFSLFFVSGFIFFFAISSRAALAENNLSQSGVISSNSAEDYLIGANDILEIAVYGEENLTQEVQVTTDGHISYPFLGRIKAAGLSVTKLEDYIRRALAKDYIRNPQVKILVREFSNVFVFGQVKEPGPYLFKGGMTVLQAVTTAGGFTKIANPRKVRVVRTHGTEREIIHVNINEITNGEKGDFILQPGDTVVVPESFF